MAGYNYGWNGRVAAARRARKACTWLPVKRPVPRPLAMRFVRDSTWWLTHPSGSPVAAPRHAERLTHGPYGWGLELGANTFLVSRAIQRSKYVLLAAYARAEAGRPMSRRDVLASLRECIACSVANYAGDEFEGPYPVRGGFLEFGGTGILVSQAASFLIGASGLKEFLR